MPPRGKVRLDRALSKLGAASRADAQRLIAAGRVRVAGRIIHDPGHFVHPERTPLEVDGALTSRPVWRTVALHKPRGVVTTRRDPEGRRTVFDLLPEGGGSLVSIGRLDRASSGLLLLTTDTQLANFLTDPDNRIPRQYVVTVRGMATDASVARLLAGIEGLRASRVSIRKRSTRETHLLIELVEGKNREIRRMLEALGHEVTRLLRIAFGPIVLGALQPGQWREVSRRELESIR